MTCHSFNRPFPSSPRPLFQNEVRCSACDMEIIFHSHANKTHFHEEGCAPNLVLKQRREGTRKNGLLFQYCLGSGLGTTGDFSSEQLLLTWPHWLPLALNVFSAEPRQHKLIQRARRYSTTWHDDVVFRSAIYLCPLWRHLIERVRDFGYGVSYKSLDFVNSRLELVPFFTRMQERSII